jgi:hypothetical protein
MFRNNIFMKYYKKMQCPFGKRGKKKGRKPHPTPGTTPWKKKKEKTSTHTLRNIQTFPLPCPKTPPSTFSLALWNYFQPLWKREEINCPTLSLPSPYFSPITLCCPLHPIPWNSLKIGSD